MNGLVRKTLLLAFGALAFLAGPAARLLLAAEAWVPAGPVGGLTRHVVIHPRNPRILWAGTFNAGVFKSLDGGTTWAPSSQGLRSDIMILALAVAPGDPNVLYAAGGQFGVLTGLYRSTDGGRTWTVMLSCPPNPVVGVGCSRLIQTFELVVDPRDARIVYALTGRGLFKSVDGGRRWNRTGRTVDRTTALAIHPGNPRVLYAGGSAGVEKSEDGGETWVPITRGMGVVQITELVIDPANPRRIWAGAAIGRGVYFTTNGGAGWQRARTGLGRWVDSLALSPRPGQSLPAVLAAGDRGIFRSLDGGFTWTPAPGLEGLFATRLAAHPGKPGSFWVAVEHSLAMDRFPGIYKSGDYGATWRLSSRGLFGLPMDALAFDPATPGVVWAGSLAHGVFRSEDGAARWKPAPGDLPALQTVYDLTVDPDDPQTVWLATFAGIWVTEDGGATWEHRSLGLKPPDTGNYPIHQVRLVPADPATAYAASFDRLFKTTDSGESWELVGPEFSSITDVLVDAEDPETIFVAAGDLQVSHDGGATWQTVPVWNAPTAILALAADPRSPDLLYAGGAEGVFRSTDRGETWQQVAFFPVSGIKDLAVGPTGEVWAVTAEGRIYRSADGTGVWTRVPGIEPFAIAEIAVDPHDADGVFLATFAGLFRLGEN